MQAYKPFVGTLCSLTRPFVAVFVLQLIALRWGMGVPLTPDALPAIAGDCARCSWAVIGALLYRVNCRAYDIAKLQHTQLLRLQKAIESAPAAVFITDPDQQHCVCEPRLYRTHEATLPKKQSGSAPTSSKAD
jgi:PAS domain-containing protein